MLIEVHFHDSGLTNEHKFTNFPLQGEIIAILIDGINKHFRALSAFSVDSANAEVTLGYIRVQPL